MKEIKVVIRDDVFESLREMTAVSIVTGNIEQRLDTQFVFLILQAIRAGKEQICFPPNLDQETDQGNGQ